MRLDIFAVFKLDTCQDTVKFERFEIKLKPILLKYASKQLFSFQRLLGFVGFVTAFQFSWCETSQQLRRDF